MIKLPRLFTEAEIRQDSIVPLAPAQAHYLRNVLRRKEGDALRLFNGRDGEWLARLAALDKKGARAQAQSRLLPQPAPPRAIHLLFAPIKKARLDFLIEKAVELGATHLHPVITRYTEVRQINQSRIAQQIIEAAEQCERLDISSIAPAQTLEALLQAWDRNVPLYACIERTESPALRELAIKGSAALLVGPEGGFAPEEKGMLHNLDFITPVSLGERVLRAETACIKGLSLI